MLGGIIGHPVKGFLDYFNFWYWQANAHKWIESNGEFLAVWALHRALELPMHQINYD